MQREYIHQARSGTAARRDSIAFANPANDQELIRFHAALSGAIEAYDNILNWDERVMEQAVQQHEKAVEKQSAGETIQDILRQEAEALSDLSDPNPALF